MNRALFLAGPSASRRALWYFSFALLFSGLAAAAPTHRLPPGVYTIGLVPGRDSCPLHQGLLLSSSCSKPNVVDLLPSVDKPGMQWWEVKAPKTWDDVTGKQVEIQAVGRSPPLAKLGCASQVRAWPQCNLGHLNLTDAAGINTKWYLDAVGPPNHYYIRSAARPKCPDQYLCMPKHCSATSTTMCTKNEEGSITVWIIQAVPGSSPPALKTAAGKAHSPPPKAAPAKGRSPPSKVAAGKAHPSPPPRPASPLGKAPAPPQAPPAPTQNRLIVPGPPILQLVEALPSGQINVTISPPSPSGGPPITGYRVAGAATAAVGGSAIATYGMGWHSTDVGKLLFTFQADSYALLTDYTFTAYASNSIGEGPPSKPVTARTPGRRPWAPKLLLAALLSSGSINITVAPPSDVGSSPLVGYRIVGVAVSGRQNISLEGGMGLPAPGGMSLFTFPEGSYLAATQYIFYVYASNADGEGPPSDPEAIVTPERVPGPPTIDRVTTSVDGPMNVTVSPPEDDGGRELGMYRVVADPVGGSQNISIAGTLGLPVGRGKRLFSFPAGSYRANQRYNFQAYATSALGEGVPSAKFAFKTPASLPGPPIIEVATVRSTFELAIAVLPPVSDGGLDIVGYLIVGEPATGGVNLTTSGEGTLMLNSGGKRKFVFPPNAFQLSTQYTFHAWAANEQGAGPSSDPYTMVTPAGPPPPAPPTPPPSPPPRPPPPSPCLTRDTPCGAASTCCLGLTCVGGAGPSGRVCASPPDKPALIYIGSSGGEAGIDVFIVPPTNKGSASTPISSYRLVLKPDQGGGNLTRTGMGTPDVVPVIPNTVVFRLGPPDYVCGISYSVYAWAANAAGESVGPTSYGPPNKYITPNC